MKLILADEIYDFSSLKWWFVLVNWIPKKDYKPDLTTGPSESHF